jgi:hypothetical protein
MADLTMYKPNFCSQCGTKLLRLHWHVWTSRRFCNDCARALRKERFLPLLFAILSLTGAGYIAGLTHRPAPPSLTIIRRTDSPLQSPEDPGRPSASTAQFGEKSADNSSGDQSTEDVYICGARTKKGTPCSRRVHGPVRCWQHKGMPAMLPQEKLLIKG